MTGYKAFQDWYIEAKIKHLILFEYQERLISPPFATEQCKDYSDVLFWDGTHLERITLDLPAVTSKTNCPLIVNDKLYFIPYGIWDGFQTVVEIDNKTPTYHQLETLGKGQFYSGASSGTQGFSFPLGYEGTNFCINITAEGVQTENFNFPSYSKLHMGTVYHNGKFWSMPRGDEPGYTNIVTYGENNFDFIEVKGIDQSVRRKYTDCFPLGDKLYALPFGEDLGLTEILELDTNTNEYSLYPFVGQDFSKKYNAFVYLDGKIIAVPYGDEHANDSNYGLIFDTESKNSWQFDIGIYHGGKYRYRSGVAYKGCAFFFPSGTPSCPILKIDKKGQIIARMYLRNFLMGRPVVWQNFLYCMAYNIKYQTHHILKFDEHLNYSEELVV